MRLEGWEDRFSEVIARHARAPFAYGVSDCAAFPMDVVRALTGEYPASFDPDYDSMTSGVRKLRERGFAHLGEAFAAAFMECPPSFARRGDIGIADYPGAVLGGGVVVIGEDVMGKGEQGTVRLPRAALVRAFRVG